MALLLTVALLSYGGFLLFGRWLKHSTHPADSQNGQVCIILDAGHGGMDGGAVSVTGTLEKNLNLQVTLLLSDMLRAAGYQTILTRTSDEMLSTAEGGKRKMQDLQARLHIAEANPDALFVSIHMNIFSQEKYSGLQVYYADAGAGSQQLANTVQNFTKLYLQPSNERLTKPATSSIYLMHKMRSTGILVECGFLSNFAEAECLDSPAYRKKLSFTLLCALTEYCNTAHGET